MAASVLGLPDPSHTITLPADDPNSAAAQDVLSALSTAPHTFLQPTSSLHAAAVLAAKRCLDDLASSVSEVQIVRRQDQRKKRKRSDHESAGFDRVLQLNQVYTEGFTTGQIWEQAKRVLEAANDEVERDLSRVAGRDSWPSSLPKADKNDGHVNLLKFDDDGFEVSPSDEEGEYADADLDDGLEGEDMGEEEAEGSVDLVHNEEDELEEDIELSSAEDSLVEEPLDTYTQDPNNLNDGFFSIDDFNRRSQFLEQQDARGEDDDGANSDEEDVDWDIDPSTMGTQTIQPPPGKSSAFEHDQVGEEESEEDGPTFGNADLDADSDEEVEEADDVETQQDGLANTNDIKYADFFEPPPQKLAKTKRMRALPKTQPPARISENEVEEDVQRAIEDVRRDLFDEDELSQDEEDDRANAPRSGLSTHEKQKAKIAEEIRRLEASNVQKRDWTLSGEARAADRPLNSLIEEDLEFERVGKPVPVITSEVSEAIEDLIKRRILAREFDEVIRRRPETVGTQNVRKGRFELDDSKPQQSLAEIYETEQLQATDPAFVDTKDEKTKKEHAEIEKLWKDLSSKLDTLSNLHYKPKVPEASVNVISDAPRIMMEDARPTAAAGAAGQSTLAPQELYAPGEDGKVAGEVVLKGGASVAKEEMSREEKLRRRRREKEKTKKRILSQQQETTSKGGKAKEKKDILSDLRRGGVKVIGRKGDVKDVDGRKAKGEKPGKGANALKL